MAAIETASIGAASDRSGNNDPDVVKEANSPRPETSENGPHISRNKSRTPSPVRAHQHRGRTSSSTTAKSSSQWGLKSPIPGNLRRDIAGESGASPVEVRGSMHGDEGTCTYLRNNVFFFAACVSVIYFLHGVLIQYSADVMQAFAHRYHVMAHEQDFLIGIERIGFVAMLIFAAFFGNRLNRPMAIGVGALMTGLGSLLCACGYFISGTTPYGRTNTLSGFVAGSLCIVDSFNTSIPSQCERKLTPERAQDAFTTMAVGQFLIGIGGALYASLGLVHMEENAPKHDSGLLIGISVGLHGVGQFAGNLLSSGFTGLPENPAGGQPAQYISGQEVVGAWWLGFPIIAFLFLMAGLWALIFPKWFVKPGWLKRREERQQDEIMKLKRKERELQKRAARQKRHRKQSSIRRSGKGAKRGSSMNGSVHTSSPPEAVTTNAQLSQLEEGSVFSSGQSNAAFDDISPDIERSASANQDVGSTSQWETDNDVVDNDVTANHSQSQSSRPRLPSAGRRKGKTSSAGKRDRQGKGRPAEEKKKKNLRKKSSKKTQKVSLRHETIKDLPRQLSKLIRNPLMLLGILASTLGSYVLIGFTANTPAYLHSQFGASQESATLTTVIGGPLAWGIGMIVSGLISYKWHFSTEHGLRGVVVTLCIGWVCLAILLGFRCDVPDIDFSIKSCRTRRCDCEGVQFEPVCGADEKTYQNPCMAGCKDTTYQGYGIFNYSKCSCVTGSSNTAVTGACWQPCSLLPAYGAVMFIAFFVSAVGMVQIILLFLRRVIRDRYRSLSLGFAIWTIYLAAYVPSPAVFRIIHNTQCVQWLEDCYGYDQCVQYNSKTLTNVHNGAALAFQSCEILVFAGLYLLVRHLNKKKSTETSVKMQEDVEFAPKRDGVPNEGFSDLAGDQETGSDYAGERL